MATSYPSSPTPLLSITEAHLWAKAQFKKDIVSGIYKIPVLLNAVALQTGNKKTFIPGKDSIIGKGVGSIDSSKVTGAEYHWKIKATRASLGKWMAENDTAPNTSDTQQVNNFLDVSCGWSRRVDPVSVPNATVTMENGDYMLGAGAVEESVRDAQSEHLDAIGISLWTGAPSNTTKTVMDNVIGLESWLSATNNILGIDRTQAANAEFRAQKSTAALPASLSLIDQICTAGVDDGAGGTTLPMQWYGAKNDLVISTYDVYMKHKAEAQTKGFQLRDMQNPEANMHNIGFLDEHFMYNGRLFTYDPAWSGTKKMVVLDTRTIAFHMNPAKAFNLSPMVDLRKALPNTGQRDVVTSEVETWMRLIVEKPKFNFFGTNIS